MSKPDLVRLKLRITNCLIFHLDIENINKKINVYPYQNEKKLNRANVKKK